MFQKLYKHLNLALLEANRYLWKYFCRAILFLFVNIIPPIWLPYLLFGTIGGMPYEINVKEERIEETKKINSMIKLVLGSRK